jgi:hypothetical protein
MPGKSSYGNGPLEPSRCFSTANIKKNPLMLRNNPVNVYTCVDNSLHL